jgi:XTP/dITP diphosphohydrolase
LKIAMVTSNINKAKEVEAFFNNELEVNHVKLDMPEIRSDDIGLIAKGKAGFAYDHLHTPLIVDDTEFSIDSLNGFPGPYAAYVLHTIGNAGILKLMECKTDRHASFTTAIAFANEKGIKVFKGSISGRITRSPRGCGGFGYDAIFEMDERTLAELSFEEKSRISHRAQALTAFHDWLMREGDLNHNNPNG